MTTPATTDPDPFGFRVARPASRSWIVAKTGVQLVVVWGFALGVLPALAVRLDRRLGLPRLAWRRRRSVGLAVFAAGSSIGMASAWVMADSGRGTPIPFDAARELVTAGPYRIVRNPMAVSAVAQAAGIALTRGSPTAALIPVCGVVLWNTFLRPPEERFLAARFGDAYRDYQRDVRCWLPTWPPYRAGETDRAATTG